MVRENQPRDFFTTTAGVLLAAVAANLLWGSAAPCIKLGYQLFKVDSDAIMTQILFAGIRFTLAGLLTILLGSLVQRRLLIPKPSSGGMILSLAMMQTVIQYTFFYIGLSHAPGYKGSISSTSSVFFALLISALIFRQEKLTFGKLFGCMVGFAGVLVISLAKAGDAAGFSLLGEGFLILAAASYGCSSVLIKRYSSREDPVVLSGWQFLLGGLIMTLLACLSGAGLHAASPWAWPLMLYLALVSAVAYTLWSLLLQRHPVSRVAVFAFLNPLFGVFLSALLLGEAKNLQPSRCLLSITLVFLGVWIVNRPDKGSQEKLPDVGGERP